MLGDPDGKFQQGVLEKAMEAARRESVSIYPSARLTGPSARWDGSSHKNLPLFLPLSLHHLGRPDEVGKLQDRETHTGKMQGKSSHGMNTDCLQTRLSTSNFQSECVFPVCVC